MHQWCVEIMILCTCIFKSWFYAFAFCSQCLSFVFSIIHVSPCSLNPSCCDSRVACPREDLLWQDHYLGCRGQRHHPIDVCRDSNTASTMSRPRSGTRRHFTRSAAADVWAQAKPSPLMSRPSTSSRPRSRTRKAFHQTRSSKMAKVCSVSWLSCVLVKSFVIVLPHADFSFSLHHTGECCWPHAGQG